MKEKFCFRGKTFKKDDYVYVIMQKPPFSNTSFDEGFILGVEGDSIIDSYLLIDTGEEYPNQIRKISFSIIFDIRKMGEKENAKKSSNKKKCWK